MTAQMASSTFNPATMPVKTSGGVSSVTLAQIMMNRSRYFRFCSVNNAAIALLLFSITMVVCLSISMSGEIEYKKHSDDNKNYQHLRPFIIGAGEQAYSQYE